MTQENPSPELLALIQAVKGKRASVVVQHILQHGSITTEELEITYGYKHPPRAIRDVREQGIPLVTFSAKNAEGRTIAAYRFGSLDSIRQDRLGGRRSFPKGFKTQLVQVSGSMCSICLQPYEERYLQVDHRIPYAVSGDEPGERQLDDYMLVCGSCNRAKSWSCEHCPNVLELKNPDLCRSCYWASPTDYQHIATIPQRRLDIVWQGEDIGVYERLKQQAEAYRLSLPEYVKTILDQYTSE